MILTLDFETLPIRRRPDYPPAPVGVALKIGDGEGFYLSWGHASGHGPADSESAVRNMVAKFWADPSVEILCHNAKFDMAVAIERWNLPELPWHRVHDTMFLHFLSDPHAPTSALKPLAQKLLGWAPEERDAVAEWILAHKAQLLGAYGARWPELKCTPKSAGAWIFAAPAELVAPYAIGDVERTRALFDLLMPEIERRGMAAAYDRERQLLPILMRNEREGMRVDMERLERDLREYTLAFDTAEEALRRGLHASGLNFDADQDVAAVLISQGIVPESNFARTATTKAHPQGLYSMSKETLLPEHFTGPNGAKVASLLGYRNRLKTCLDTFMRPWYAQARDNRGYITTNWNQTRGAGGGTRTGRPSTNEHNFLNLAKSFEGRDDQYQHPAFLDLPALPLCRRYILPDEGDVFIHRDFSGQELRVFAHFEQGDLWRKYQENPRLDPHGFVGEQLKAVAQREIERTRIKVMNFQALYGGGVPALQNKLRCSRSEAQELKRFHDQALPGRKLLNEEITRVIRRQEPIRTLGGREYFAEPNGPDGRDKIYKLINYIIQGSAADLTKQAIIDWHADADKKARFMVTVYDEIDASAPADDWRRQMEVLRRNMEAPRCSVPMLSDGKVGPGWGELEPSDAP